MSLKIESTVPFSMRLSRELDFQLRQRAAVEGLTLSQLHMQALKEFLSTDSISDQILRLERSMLGKIFAVVASVANLSADERSAAKAALKAILMAESVQ